MKQRPFDVSEFLKMVCYGFMRQIRLAIYALLGARSTWAEWLDHAAWSVLQSRTVSPLIEFQKCVDRCWDSILNRSLKFTVTVYLIRVQYIWLYHIYKLFQEYSTIDSPDLSPGSPPWDTNRTNRTRSSGGKYESALFWAPPSKICLFIYAYG